jgi:hypothetical protein
MKYSSLFTLIKSVKLICLMALQLIVMNGFNQVVGTGIIPRHKSLVNG